MLAVLAICPRRGRYNARRFLDFLIQVLTSEDPEVNYDRMRCEALKLGLGFPNLYARRCFFSALEMQLLYFRDVFDRTPQAYHEADVLILVELN